MKQDNCASKPCFKALLITVGRKTQTKMLPSWLFLVSKKICAFLIYVDAPNFRRIVRPRHIGCLLRKLR